MVTRFPRKLVLSAQELNVKPEQSEPFFQEPNAEPEPLNHLKSQFSRLSLRAEHKHKITLHERSREILVLAIAENQRKRTTGEEHKVRKSDSSQFCLSRYYYIYDKSSNQIHAKTSRGNHQKYGLEGQCTVASHGAMVASKTQEIMIVKKARQ